MYKLVNQYSSDLMFERQVLSVWKIDANELSVLNKDAMSRVTLTFCISP